jgi:hypothetical protein
MRVTAIARGARESLERQNLSIRSFAEPLWQLSQTKCPFSHAALEMASESSDALPINQAAGKTSQDTLTDSASVI